MAFTVVPIHNLTLPTGAQVQFGDTFVLRNTPEWLKTDEGVLRDLSAHDRRRTIDSQFALVAEYSANGIGDLDPASPKGSPQSIQRSKMVAALLVNLAFWIRQPSPVCLSVGFHGLIWRAPGASTEVPVVQQTEVETQLYCHPADVENPVEVRHVRKASELFVAFAGVPRGNAVWEAMRSTWAALTMYSVDRRYPFFWMALEALFGSNETTELSYKLAQRISFFLAETPADARDLFQKVKACYKFRSIIVHGRWENNSKIDIAMADTEAIVRTVFRHLLENPTLLKIFISKERDKFLENFVYSNASSLRTRSLEELTGNK